MGYFQNIITNSHTIYPLTVLLLDICSYYYESCTQYYTKYPISFRYKYNVTFFISWYGRSHDRDGCRSTSPFYFIRFMFKIIPSNETK
ncbi:hypothetical protein SAMN04487850_0881 [Prevotella aff. ruminicola Tc2-24]|uniref:Uncharacterized protein n=1 Tax=Prevotella aff. ruminicola Tc2-24 TaxID=81582 RepID=A0A1I0N0I7_9BACT|nr:hypothetical protein SAMN04487828_0093 [Prevotella sp. lc2012]SEV94532.1 hypothetical protein SAMN04487850_0881 [Prevotella aff. ruminicola Tc2-24]